MLAQSRSDAISRAGITDQQAENLVNTPNVEWSEKRGALTIYHTGQVSYQLKPGPLKEQVVQMLIDAGRVKSENDVVWSVSSNHIWSNDFAVSGESFDHLLGRVLQTYRMAVIYQANNVAVIRYIERS